MSRFRLTIQGKQLQKRSVEKLVRSLKDLKKKGEIEITVEEDNPPTSRAAPEEGGRMTQVTLRCYCCGEPISGEIALVTMSPTAVDRVFVALPEHIERFDDESTNVMLVNPSIPRRE
jgi:hypothetical protein